MQNVNQSKNGEKKRPFFRLISLRLSDSGKNFISLFSRVKAKAVLFASKRNFDSKTCLEYVKYALFTVFAFFLSIARFPLMAYPFGIALLCSVSGNRYALLALAGAGAACITYDRMQLPFFIIYLFIYAARKAFTDSKFDDSVKTRIVECAFASAAAGIIRILSEFEASFYSYTASLSTSLIACSFTYFFSVVLSKELFSKSKRSVKTVCVYALIFAFVSSFSGFSFAGFDVQLIISALITLVFAAGNGFMYSAVAGLICGLACSNPALCASLGVSGIICGFVFSKSLFASLASFALSFLVCQTYSFGISSALSLTPSVICSCVLFFPVFAFLPDSFKIYPALKKKSAVKEESDGGVYHKKLSDAMFSLSDVFSKLSEKQKHPSFSAVNLAIDKSFSDVCSKCALGEMCYAKKKTDIFELKNGLFSVLAQKPCDESDFGNHMKDKCIRLEAICDEINYQYRELCAKSLKNNGSALIASQYAGMARLILDAKRKETDESERDAVSEAKIMQALKDAQIDFSSVCVSSKRRRTARISGINVDKFPFNSEEFKNYIYAKCGYLATYPSFDLSDSADVILSFERAPQISVEYALSSEPKDRDDINGDTVNFISGENGFFYAFLCDGMGSGREAALSSRLSSVFLERMIETRAEKSIVLELLNNALISQNEESESFSTVDFFEADLLDGKCSFIKAGAAPTYVLRAGKLYRIFSSTPPVGIIPSFTAESTRFDVECGDVIIMMSDGVIPSGDDMSFLANLIHVDASYDPASLSRKILEKSKELCVKKDDMSVAVIKIRAA
ncbi:MAG: SpoIIE family protein phosphatase [Clostridia bacterium]|nr:SpoIIE family protein phosphatase [Clostridia bacterium]